MLRISKLTDYGVVLATRMAGGAPGARHHARELARETGLSEPTVSKVLKRLAQCGVVSSQRGSRGGYQLAQAPEAISVAEVITALEGPIAVTECASDATCELEDRCEVRAPWQRISAAVNRALDAISLADMAQPTAPLLIQLTTGSDTDGQRRWARPRRGQSPTLAHRLATGPESDKEAPEQSS